MAHAARLSLILLVVALAACGGSGGKTKASRSCPTTGRDVTFPLLDPKRQHTVDVLTNEGHFAFRLDVRHSPCVTSSFASLVRKRFFDGTVFHRIVPGFVIQGGDPTATGTGGPGYAVVDVPPKGARYTRGVVAMAKTQSEPPGTAGSQFFIVTGPDAGLPPDYAILGVVTKGLDVVKRIGRLGNPVTERPTKRVVVRRMTVA
ncbi:MAG TPA: peptidylprolyl isomerase [Gaiellaceae bacterium]|nr:peptidylprolyl isomerase [Gaiellaceae bacterium]